MMDSLCLQGFPFENAIRLSGKPIHRFAFGGTTKSQRTQNTGRYIRMYSISMANPSGPRHDEYKGIAATQRHEHGAFEARPALIAPCGRRTVLEYADKEPQGTAMWHAMAFA